MFSLLQYRPIQTLVLIGLYCYFSSYLDRNVHESFYTISVLIKDLLMWLMPITVGIFIASTICTFKNQATLFIITLMLFEIFSNFLSVSYGYLVGTLVNTNLTHLGIITFENNLTPLWRIPLIKPAWWSADKGTIIGMAVGCILGLSRFEFLRSPFYKIRNIIEWVLTKIFAALIPLFVLGFVANIYTTGVLYHIAVNYGTLVLYLLAAMVIYLLGIFGIGNLFNFSEMLHNIKNLLPAGVVAFSSGCSLSTMPWTIAGTALNLKSPVLADVIIPATTNIQQIGDCIINSILCFILYSNFYGYNPDIITWLTFTIVFVAVRLTTVAMLGGAVFLLLPVYQYYLNFTDEMLAVMLAFNIILDPIITSSNVIANGGLAKIFESVWGRVQKFKWAAVFIPHS